MQQPANLMETLAARVKQAPDKLAFAYLDDQCDVVNQLSNQQLYTRATAVAGKLQQIIDPSDRVLLLFPQGLEFIYAFLGVMYSGAVPVVTAPPRATQHDDTRICHVEDIIEETGSNVVLTSSSILNEVVQCFFKSSKLSQKILLAVEDVNDDLTNHWTMPVVDSNSTAYLQRTSASTREGSPKFVMISHDNINSVHESIKNDYKLTASSRSVHWLPNYHYLGLALGVLQPLYCGYRGYICSQFDFYKNPGSWLNAITRYEITFSGAPDFAYRMCVDQVSDSKENTLNLSGWKTAYSSGESVNKETMDSFLKKFSYCGLKEMALTSFYGLAESAYVASENNYPKSPTIIPRKSMQRLSGGMAENNQDSYAEVKITSCGPPVSDTRVVIIIPGTLTRCSELELGEILISSKCNALGYWNQPAETERIFNVYPEGSEDGPYLRTGDLGFIKGGEVHVVGSLTDYRKETRSLVSISG